jgi:hypothetical protein
MAKTSRPDDLVDWTITYAPEAGEVLAPHAPPLPLAPPVVLRRLPRRIDWRVVGLILSPLLIALITINLTNAWNNFRLRRDLSAAVAAEDAAILTSQIESLHYGAADAAWLNQQLHRAEAMQPAPLPLHGLWPSTAAPEVRGMRATGPNTARVEVARTFYGPTGSPAAFVLTQYYQFADGAWQRTAPPAAYAGTVTQWRGQYLEVSYYEADEDLVLALSETLEATIGEACVLWVCPTGLRFDLRFLLDDASTLRRFDYFSPEPSLPWLFTVLLSKRDTFEGSLTVLLPAPHAAGAPADAASQHLYRSGISVELLARLAAHLSPVSRRYNVLPYALAARLGADLGLEAPTVAQTRSASEVYSADELWRLNFLSTERPFGPHYTLAAQRQALALINGLLTGQPPEAAGRLFTGLAAAPDPETWVANALQVTRAEGAERLSAALVHPQLAAMPSLLTARGALTLGCHNGLAGLPAGSGAPQYALVGGTVDARPLAWSPEGDYLLASFAGRPGVVTTATGAVTWLPEAQGFLEHAEWASNSIVAYVVWGYDALGRRFDAADFALRFYDVAHPEASPAPMPGVLAYTLSPNHQTAAVVLSDEGSGAFSRSGRLALMPALGGPLTLLGQGQSPAWAPDGQGLAYLNSDGQAARLHLYTPRTGLDEIRFRVAPAGLSGRSLDLVAAWSPQGDQLWLAVRDGSLALGARAWLVPAGGGKPRPVLSGNEAAYPYPANFSADGRYLSVLTWTSYWPRLTRVFDTSSGEPVLSLPSAGGETAWAPEGHALAVGSFEGLGVVAEPGTGAVTRLTTEACYTALWQ